MRKCTAWPNISRTLKAQSRRRFDQDHPLASSHFVLRGPGRGSSECSTTSTGAGNRPTARTSRKETCARSPPHRRRRRTQGPSTVASHPPSTTNDITTATITTSTIHDSLHTTPTFEPLSHSLRARIAPSIPRRSPRDHTFSSQRPRTRQLRTSTRTRLRRTTAACLRSPAGLRPGSAVA